MCVFFLDSIILVFKHQSNQIAVPFVLVLVKLKIPRFDFEPFVFQLLLQKKQVFDNFCMPLYTYLTLYIYIGCPIMNETFFCKLHMAATAQFVNIWLPEHSSSVSSLNTQHLIQKRSCPYSYPFCQLKKEERSGVAILSLEKKFTLILRSRINFSWRKTLIFCDNNN